MISSKWKYIHFEMGKVWWYQYTWLWKGIVFEHQSSDITMNLLQFICHMLNYTWKGTILCMYPANERWRYIVTPSHIGWVHTQNDPCMKNAFTFYTVPSLKWQENHYLQSWNITQNYKLGKYISVRWTCQDMMIAS